MRKMNESEFAILCNKFCRMNRSFVRTRGWMERIDNILILIVIISLVVFLVPENWISILGFAPIVIHLGVLEWIKAYRSRLEKKWKDLELHIEDQYGTEALAKVQSSWMWKDKWRHFC